MILGYSFVEFIFLFDNYYLLQLCVQAALYQTDYRPVPLEEYIKIGDSIYNKRLEIVRTIPKAADLGGKDPDHIVELCNEVTLFGLFFLTSVL